jgi:hypothetical protein
MHRIYWLIVLGSDCGNGTADRIELTLEREAEGPNDADDDHGDESDHQAVLDCRCALFISYETALEGRDKTKHVLPPVGDDPLTKVIGGCSARL